MRIETVAVEQIKVGDTVLQGRREYVVELTEKSKDRVFGIRGITLHLRPAPGGGPVMKLQTNKIERVI